MKVHIGWPLALALLTAIALFARPDFLMGVPEVQANVEEISLYATADIDHACGDVRGMPVGYGPHIQGWSHYAVCWVDGKLVEFRQGIRQKKADVHNSRHVETWMGRNAERVVFAMHKIGGCGVDTFVGVADPMEGTKNVFPWDGVSSGASVDGGHPTCYSAERKQLYVRVGLSEVVLYEHFTLDDDFDLN